MIVDEFGHEWGENDVIVWFDPTYISDDGKVIPDDWEMVCPVKRKCIEHFKTKEEVEEYAKKHHLNILKWDMD